MAGKSSYEPVVLSAGVISCTRAKCTRKIGLNAFNLCGGHACAVPGCPESKSSTVYICEKHEENSKKPLPKNWVMAAFTDCVPIYYNHPEQTVQYDHPSLGILKNDPAKKQKLMKTRKGMPLYYNVLPQPGKLLKDWIKVLCVPDAKNPLDGSMFLFVNSIDGRVSAQDPTPLEVVDAEGALPEGWKTITDLDGDVAYTNLNTGMSTYEDPRIIHAPTPSLVANIASQKPEDKEKKIEGRAALVRTKSKKFKPEDVWRIGPCDGTEFELVDNNLVDVNVLPVGVRNKKYNRFLDILPNPVTRVPLPRINDDIDTEYINANYVRGFDGNPKMYIAAMGPLELSVHNFWRMIWLESCSIIIMATDFFEGGKQKCFPYFNPTLDAVITIGGFEITTSDCSQYNGYRLTQLSVKNGKEKRALSHFWFNTWPDHGVPIDSSGAKYVDSSLDFIEAVNTQIAKESKKGVTPPPILVHCSAGIGRTGTFIGMHWAIKELNEQSKTDCVEIVKKMREHRSAMVQHKMQFEFFHEAVVRYCERVVHPFKVEAFDFVPLDDVVPLAQDTDPAEMSRIRREEKLAAAKKMEQAKLSGKKTVSTSSANSGELSLGFVEFKGEKYQFVDPDGNGLMDITEARSQGMPDELFRLMSDQNGDVSVAMFKLYQEKVKKAAVIVRRASMRLSKASF